MQKLTTTLCKYSCILHNLVGAGNIYIHNALIASWRIPMRHLHRLGYVAATLILLQVFPLQIGFRPLGISVARGQTSEQRRNEAARLNQLGLQQLNKGELQEALKAFEQALAMTKQIGDKDAERVILNNIGEVYRSLGQYPEALLSTLR